MLKEKRFGHSSLYGRHSVLTVCTLLAGFWAGDIMAQHNDLRYQAQTRFDGTIKLERKDSISQYGISWSFDKKVPVGQFVTGDNYVVGLVTVTKVTPYPVGEGQTFRNGSMVNPPTNASQAYDGRIGGFDPKLIVTFPLTMKPGDSLVSAISLATLQQNQILADPSRPVEDSPLKTLAVLTCLATPVPVDAFRPSYCDLEKDRFLLARNIHWELLPRFEPTEGAPGLAKIERMFERPWIDHVYGWDSRDIHASENMPGYGREIGRAVSLAALLLCCDYPKEKKEKLCQRFIQVGIDNWGVAVRSKRGLAGGWPAAGGFGSGRKLPIVFAGIMLNDEQMLNIKKYAPEASFGEDEHVESGPTWTGAKVRFTGQYPMIGHEQRDRGPYEHLHPGQWPGDRRTLSEGYRRCCTSVCWVGQALAIRMMRAEKIWDHDAFFAYVDRWMYEDDTKFVEEIRKINPDFSPKTIHQGTTAFDPWIDMMWIKYRKTLSAPSDSWK